MNTRLLWLAGELHRLDDDEPDYNVVLKWCSTHQEPVWVYSDGSYTCPHDLVVEARGQHEITSFPKPGEKR